MILDQGNPIREIWSRTRGRGYALSDLLTQAISLGFGFYFLDEGVRDVLTTAHDMQGEFERAVMQQLDSKAAESFREFSQVRLPEADFEELFRYWSGFGGKKEKLRASIERLITLDLSRAYRRDLAVPAWLERFAMELLPVTPGTFYDGTAGAGNMAIRMAKYGAENDMALSIVTREADPFLFHLSVLRARMHGFSFRQENEDCLHAEGCGVDKGADRSIMFPPLRGGEPVFVEGKISCGSDWSYAYHQLQALNENGVGICRIPNGALFNAKNLPFRKYLIQQNVLDAIIALPKSAAPFSAAPATSLVILRKGRKKNDAVRMMEFHAPICPESNLRSNRSLCLTGKNLLAVMQENGFQLAPSDLDAENLSPQRYLPEGQKKESGRQEDPADQRQKTVRLGDAAEIYRGLNPAPLSRQEGGRKLLRLADVQDGRICMKETEGYDLSTRALERYRIQKGDILISCKGKAIKLCAVSEEMPVFLSHDFLGIRVKDGKIDPQYLFYFLQSPAGQCAIQQIQMGSSIPMIRAKDLEDLTLPYIPLARQTRYAQELHKTVSDIEEKMAKLYAAKQRAYEQFYQKTGFGDAL